MFTGLELRLHRHGSHHEGSIIPGLRFVCDIYEIQNSLGTGGFGEVKKARHHQENKVYAIKFIREDQMKTRVVDEPPTASQEHRRKYLTDEIEIMKRLHHPNIVDFKEALEDHGVLGM